MPVVALLIPELWVAYKIPDERVPLGGTTISRYSIEPESRGTFSFSFLTQDLVCINLL